MNQIKRLKTNLNPLLKKLSKAQRKMRQATPMQEKSRWPSLAIQPTPTPLNHQIKHLQNQQTTDQQTTDQQTTDQQTTDQQATDQQAADQQATDQQAADEEFPTYQPPKKDAPPAEPTIEIPATWKRLSKKQEIWIDNKNKQVIVGGKVCLDAGPLEMLICPPNTKEHESIVVVNAASWQVDAALQAIGATKGVPCRWDPEYAPAWGAKIDIKMIWRDEKTKKVKTADAKQWVLNVDTQKPMTAELVFGGSRTEAQFEGEKARYLGDDGELICLANFATSTIDLHVTKANTDIFFEANTPQIPPINTQVYTVITPGRVIGKPEE